MAKVVVGLFDRFEDAQAAVRDLTDKGFPRENISMVASDAEGKYQEYAPREEGEDVSDGAAAGAGIGAVVGGLGGLLVGLGALTIPGIGPVLAAGPLVSALVGAGVGAAAGGLIGALVDLGIPEEQANLYAEGVRRGGTLVTVHTTDDMSDRAVDILNNHNPVDINQRSEHWRQGDWQSFDRTAEPYTPDMIERERAQYRDIDLDKEDLEVVEEEMVVGKREVPSGGVRIHTYVTEKPVEETVNLRKEHIEVERRPVDRPASEKDLETFEEGTVEVTATSEEAVAGKRARVVEEVEVHKDVEQEQETIRDTLRRKDVEVEPIEGREDFDYDTYEPMFQSHYQTSYSRMGRDYDEFRPAYYYGYDLANDPRYRNRDWNEVQREARMEWERENRDTAWEDVKEAVHQGWMSVQRKF